MQLQLNAVDVFKAAVMLEERAARFYTGAAGKASGQPRQLLLQLSEMETGHARQFSLILDELAATVRGSGEPEEGADDFLQVLTGDRVITQDCQIEEGDGYETILEKAMQIEKNSVFFYTAVKETMQEKMAAGAVERIIQEEVAHFRMLSDALRSWRGQGGAR
jgi:rubrerythrin